MLVGKYSRNVDPISDRSGFIADLASAGTTYDVFRALKNLVRAHGYERFIIFRMPVNHQAALGDLTIITNWEPELIKAYDAMSLLAQSPVIQNLSESILPFTWEIEELNKHRDKDGASEAVKLFRQFGLINGIYFSAADRKGGRGAMGLAGDRQPPDEDEFKELSYYSSYIYQKLSEIEDFTFANHNRLTPRERDCVYWTAAGKTSGETATILGLTENTVNHYLSSAANKLDTVNKAHTVAKAIRLGILEQ